MGPGIFFVGLSAAGVWLVSKLKDSPNPSVVNIKPATTAVAFDSSLGNKTIVNSAPPNFASSKAGGSSGGGGCCCRNNGGVQAGTPSKGPTLVQANSAAPSLGISGPQPGLPPGQPNKDYGPFSMLGV
jgi:hypothetical protein